MPDKPTWYSRLNQIIADLEQAPTPWIDGALLESLLGISRRRAQQILRPLVRHNLGRNGLALKKEVIQHLRSLASGSDAEFEQQRRQRLHSLLADAHHQLRRQPPVLVEAPTTILSQQLQLLPPGIHLSPGRIVIEQFATPEQAKQLLLALILAMGNNPDEFDRCITAK